MYPIFYLFKIYLLAFLYLSYFHMFLRLFLAGI